MSFTPADVLLEVREQIQDADSAAYRYSDAMVIRKINQTLKRICILRPDLFSTVATMTCVAGSLQSAPADSARLMDVISATDGRAVKQVNQETLDILYPTWDPAATGIPTNWMRYPRDPNRFFVYPVPTVLDTLQIIYAKTPSTYSANDLLPIGDVYLPVVVDCVIWLLESVDAEHVESGRAKMFWDSFKEMIQASMQARKLTDSPAAGEDPKDVI